MSSAHDADGGHSSSDDSDYGNLPPPPWVLEVEVDPPAAAAFLPPPDPKDVIPRYEMSIVSQPGAYTLKSRRNSGFKFSEGLREYKALCDRLLPGLRTGSHLARLIASPDAHSISLREHTSVIGGATFRLVSCQTAPLLVLLVEIIFVDQKPSVAGHGHGTRLVNYLKAILLTEARRRGLPAAMLTQADVHPAARLFWARQHLRATPDALQLVRCLYQFNHKCAIYRNAIPMVAWLEPLPPPAASGARGGRRGGGKEGTGLGLPASPALLEPRPSLRAQQEASVKHAEPRARATRHTGEVRVKLRGCHTLLPPIERRMSDELLHSQSLYNEQVAAEAAAQAAAEGATEAAAEAAGG
eukprot:CAMPEP_0185524550 /NCGR_PEP_ID=MMETSP1366-20130426/88411_1 /TAXON_ID=38817 /ORGANISM="Gephyrocapsa oceanica, Strain RCC1303" /LENGTH=355 /DNA_ID=CAMNT_0028135905 /DNA_START=115 /DNA_END=1178 /DNA_ORIENTATION=-